MASRGGRQGGGAIALGPGPVVGARAKLDFLWALIGSQWGIQGGGDPGMIRPPSRTCPDTENLCKVFFGGRMTSRGQCPRGGGVFVNVQEGGGGVFQIPGGWMTSRGQCPRGGACECPRGGGGVFQFPGGWMTSRGQCPRGGACECPRGGGVFNFPEGG